MSIQRFVVASAFSLLSVSLGTLASAVAWSKDEAAIQSAGQCEARIVSAQTEFPVEAQNRGEGGVVRVQVVLDKDGRVTSSEIARSSGSKTLDRAAKQSVSTDWRFDVSHCIASAVPVTQQVDVVYRKVPKSFSASINHRGISFAKRAAANDQCTVVPVDRNSTVISCIERATPGGIAASGLATR
jgi:TonB family protein